MVNVDFIRVYTNCSAVRSMVELLYIFKCQIVPIVRRVSEVDQT